MRSVAGTLELALLGTRVRVAVDDPELARRVALSYGAAPGPVVDEPRVVAPAQGPPLRARLERGHGGWRAVVDGREPVAAADPHGALRALHHELLHALMRRAPRLFFVHAAVVELDGLGIALPGLSGAGKSTLALAALCAGAGYLSDELLAFDPERRVALAFPRAPKLREVCFGWFPGLERDLAGAGEERILPLARLPGAGLLAETRIGAVVVPRWDPQGRDEPLPVSPGEALLELAGSALNFGTHRQRSLDHLTSLARGVRAFRVGWRDPHAAVAALRASLGAGRPA